MTKTLAPLPFALLSLLALAPTVGRAQADAATAPPVAGVWRTEDGKGLIEVRLAADGTLEGVVQGGSGDPDRRDANNPDPALRDRKLTGTRILWGFKPDNDERTAWADGKIYDPDNGKTYSCKLRLDEGKLRIRGYVGVSLFGRTAIWTREK